MIFKLNPLEFDEKHRAIVISIVAFHTTCLSFTRLAGIQLDISSIYFLNTSTRQDSFYMNNIKFVAIISFHYCKYTHVFSYWLFNHMQLDVLVKNAITTKYFLARMQRCVRENPKLLASGGSFLLILHCDVITMMIIEIPTKTRHKYNKGKQHSHLSVDGLHGGTQLSFYSTSKSMEDLLFEWQAGLAFLHKDFYSCLIRLWDSFLSCDQKQ